MPATLRLICGHGSHLIGPGMIGLGLMEASPAETGRSATSAILHLEG